MAPTGRSFSPLPLAWPDGAETSLPFTQKGACQMNAATAANADACAFAGMDAVEIKVTIRPDQELRAERAMQVDEDLADIRLIYFYDTENLDLFNSGTVLRARLVKGDDDNSTIKFRPAPDADDLAPWKELEGFKLEADCVGKKVVCSASLTTVQRRDEIDEVAEGKRNIEKLFCGDQERFLAQFSRKPIDFNNLCIMGPIRVLRWKVEHKGFPHELTVEEWRLPDGDDLVEVSIKVAPDEAPVARKAFEQHLTDLKLDPGGAQETKTRTALEYFAKACWEGGVRD